MEVAPQVPIKVENTMKPQPQLTCGTQEVNPIDVMIPNDVKEGKLH